jgi:threonine synthase
MDIQVSSNFERLLFDLSGRDGVALSGMMGAFEATKTLSIPADMLVSARTLFSSRRVDGDNMSMSMRWAHDRCGQMIDPHTAIGLSAARDMDLAGVPVVTLATAHPAKFRDAVERATGIRPALPARVAGLFDRQERFDTLPATLDAVKGYVFERSA